MDELFPTTYMVWPNEVEE